MLDLLEHGENLIPFSYFDPPGLTVLLLLTPWLHGSEIDFHTTSPRRGDNFQHYQRLLA